MSHPSSPNDQREWHVLLGGERQGPLSREALRTLLDSHVDGWQASVWRLGMLDWRSAASVAALSPASPASEPPLVRPGAPLVDPPPASAAALRNTAGELKVLSYEDRHLPREFRAEVATQPPPAPIHIVETMDAAPEPPLTPSLAATGEWSAVGTSELSAIGTSELRALSKEEPGLAGTSEWAAVGTSELSAIGTSELRAWAANPLSEPTISELRAVTTRELLDKSSLPSVIVSGETSTELPSFTFRAERSAAPPAPGGATPTPRALPVFSPPAASLPPRLARAPKGAPRPRVRLLVMGGLLLLSALALGSALTLRWLRASEQSASAERVYRRPPPPPQPVAAPPQAPVAAPAAAALPDFEAPLALDPLPIAPVEDVIAAEPAAPRAPRLGRRSGASGGGERRTARRVESGRVSKDRVPVHLSNDAHSKVVCSLPRGSVRSLLTELPGVDGRWFAVRCDGQAVGWVHEKDLALER